MAKLKFNITILFFILSFSTTLLSQEQNKVDWRKKSENVKANFYQVNDDFNDYWKGKKASKGQGHGVYKRWAKYMTPRVYPSGDMLLPSSNLDNYKQWERTHGTSTDVSTRSLNGNWTEIGPNVKPSGYDGGVGRVDFIRFDPNNANTYYCGTPDGGLWKTINGNDAVPHWTTNHDFLPVIGCADLAIAPDGTMYLATGTWEGDKEKRSVGVLKSTDNGDTWTATGLSWAVTDDYKIRKMVMDPMNPLIMMVATDGGVWRTTDGWATAVSGPVESLDGNYNIDDIKFKPDNQNTVYASGRNTDNNEVFWKSTDKGATWTAVTAGLPDASDLSRIIIGVTKADVAYVYLLAGNANNGYNGTYRSTDSGDTFSTMSTSPNILNSDIPASNDGGQANHDLAIAVAPDAADLVIIGGINQWRSFDGGATWTLLTYWNGTDPAVEGGERDEPYVHADVQSIEFLPNNNTTMITTCDGGIYRTTDDGATWLDISGNLGISQQSDVAIYQQDENVIVAGLQDIGTIARASDGTWSVINGGDGESAFIDYDDVQNVVTSNPNGAHDYSPNGGVNQYSLLGNGLANGTEFFSPILQDPVTSTICYAGGRSELYKSTTYQNAESETHSWTSIGTPSGSGSITSFAVYAANPQIIYTVKWDMTSKSRVSKTTDGGGSWSDITGSLPVNASSITNIAMSNTDPNKVWVVFSGYEAANKVYKTIDGGATWTDVNSAGLPNIPINTIVYRNNSNDEVYIGADIGVFVINNSLTEWNSFFTALPRCTVSDLNISYASNKIVAATYGRGTWVSDLYDSEVNTNKDWTFLVYLIGSNLESGGNAGTNDIEEIIAAGSTENVNVVVLTGGADKDGWREPIAKLYNNGQETILDFDAGGKQMSSAENVTAFIDWSIENYPAQKTALTFWNHGGDIRGYGNDEVSGMNLTVPQIKEALANTNFITNNNKFEMLGFDACLMGNIETVATLQDYVNWYIGSEEQEPGHGWNYTPIIQALNTANSTFTGEDLGRAVVDGFIAQANAEETTAITLGVINTSKIGALENSLTALFAKLVEDNKVTKLHKARAKSEEYSKSISNPENSEDMVDIGDLMAMLKKIAPELSTEVDDVLAKLGEAVSYSKNDMARPRATGLSMYIPHNALVDETALYKVLDDHYYPIDFKVEIRNFVYDTYTPQALADNNPPGGEVDPDFVLYTSGGGGDVNKIVGEVSAIRVLHDDDLEQVQVMLIEELEGFPDEFIMLGSTHVDTMAIDEDGLEVYAYVWDEHWLSINGHPAYISDIHDYEIEEDGEITEYTRVHIPMVSNLETDDEEFLIVAYRFDGDLNYVLESIIPEPYEDDNGNLIIPKKRVELKPGDQVQLLYEGFNEVTDEEFFLVDDDAIITIENGNSDLELNYDRLEVGNYQLGFLLEDHSQNDTLIFDRTIYTVEALGTQTIANDDHYELFPNPTNNEFSIKILDSKGEAFDLMIFDSMGRLVHSQSGNQELTTLSLNLSSGIYSIEITMDNQIVSDRIIIQK